MSEKKYLKKLSETFKNTLDTIEKFGENLGENLGAYMWIIPGVFFVLFC